MLQYLSQHQKQVKHLNTYVFEGIVLLGQDFIEKLSKNVSHVHKIGVALGDTGRQASPAVH